MLPPAIAELVGSIPACAGEPGHSVGLAARVRVYPRVCGGTDTDDNPRIPCHGLSPACAGEPSVPEQRLPVASVYPRVCGGTPLTAKSSHIAPGLSPRVRGNPLGMVGGVVPGGSIPACAGEPLEQDRERRRAAVYPRVCGGTGRRIAGAAQVVGLSPRVRGNPK